MCNTADSAVEFNHNGNVYAGTLILGGAHRLTYRQITPLRLFKRLYARTTRNGREVFVRVRSEHDLWVLRREHRDGVITLHNLFAATFVHKSNVIGDGTCSVSFEEEREEVHTGSRELVGV